MKNIQKKTNTLTLHLLSIGILLHLLYSFFFTIKGVGIAIFAMLSAMFLSFVWFLNKKKFMSSISEIGISCQSDLRFFPLALFVYATFSLFISTFYYLTHYGIGLNLNSFLGFILDLLMFFTLISCTVISEYRKTCYRSLLLFVGISLGFFLLQAIYWYFLGSGLDYMAPITGREQRLIGHRFIINGIQVKRLSGLFAEPAVYAFIMVCLSHFLPLKKLYWLALHAFIVLSVIFSFSLSGYLLLMFSLFLRLISTNLLKNKWNLLVVAIVIAVMIRFVFPFIDFYINNRLPDIESDGSYMDRMSFYDSVYTVFSEHIVYALFGVGMSSRFVIPSTVTFWQSSMVGFGILGTLLLVMWLLHILYFVRIGLTDKLFIFFSGVVINYTFTTSLAWFILGSMIFLAVNKEISGQTKCFKCKVKYLRL